MKFKISIHLKKLNINHKLTLHFDTGINRIGISQSEKKRCNKLLLQNKLMYFV